MTSPLQSLYRAPDSFDTVQLEYTALYRSTIIARASDPRNVPGVIGDYASSYAPLPPSASKGADETIRFEWIVWWRRPECWRDEIIRPDGTRAINLITATDGASQLVGPGNAGLVHFPKSMQRAGKVVFSKPRLESRLREIPLPAPVALRTGWKLSVLGEVEFIGRAATNIEARRTEHSAHFLMDAADTFDLIVDQERGVILRCAAIIGGHEAAVFTASVVRFDEELPANLFNFDP